jgi:thiamine biosynthesis lipoprotein
MSHVFAAERLQESRGYLGTVVQVTVCYEAGRKDKAVLALKAGWQKFADAHAHMNAFDPASDVSALNASLGREIKVSDDVYALLEKSRRYVEMTGGVFDVSVGPLVMLWGQAGKRGYLPTAEEIRKARILVGADRIELLGHGRVRIPRGMKIDLGGDASGFVADEAADVLRAAGFRDFLIDAGGEIYAGGQACEGRPWRVGISDPERKGRWTDVVELKDLAVSTSGSYEKYVEINGERWPHIVNPLTGYPERGVVSATVIAPHAVDADVLSTALCILGPGPGFKLINGLGDGYAAMIMTENVAGKLEENATRGYAVFRVK